jgi:phospholipase/carboxylesterase
MGEGTSAVTGFVHRFVPARGSSRAPLLLLHGTGGDENDLIALGQRIAPGAALLSPRGKVPENGMPRFFRRLAEGVFDLEDLRQRTAELADFVGAARRSYGIAPPIAVGFSNGANIAASILLSRPKVLAGAILMRAMMPFEPDQMPNLLGTPVFILSGRMDPIVPADHPRQLAKLLAAAGAVVRHEVLTAGHALTQADLDLAARWLEDVEKKIRSTTD